MVSKLVALDGNEAIPADYQEYSGGGGGQIGGFGMPVFGGSINSFQLMVSSKQLPSSSLGHAIRRPFSTWSLFLISNSTWLEAESSDKIIALFKSYVGFGRAIGRDHAAVWFGRLPWSTASTLSAKSGLSVSYREDPPDDARGTDLAAQIDTRKCADYCAKFKLDINRGPHVVVTKQYPGLDQQLDDHIVIALNTLKPASTSKLLSTLASQIINNKLDQAGLASQKWRLIWRDAVGAALRSLSSVFDRVAVTAWGVKVETALRKPEERQPDRAAPTAQERRKARKLRNEDKAMTPEERRKARKRRKKKKRK